MPETKVVQILLGDILLPYPLIPIIMYVDNRPIHENYVSILSLCFREAVTKLKKEIKVKITLAFGLSLPHQ